MTKKLPTFHKKSWSHFSALFHTVIKESVKSSFDEFFFSCVEIAEIYIIFSHFLQKFRESNVFTKGISKLVHLTNFFSVWKLHTYVRKFTLTHFFPKISWKQRSLKHFFSFFQCGNYRNLLRTLSAFGRQHFLFVNGILWNFPSLKLVV